LKDKEGFGELRRKAVGDWTWGADAGCCVGVGGGWRGRLEEARTGCGAHNKCPQDPASDQQSEDRYEHPSGKNEERTY
jgi:hypothetical protein